jgi:hypothetical protein
MVWFEDPLQLGRLDIAVLAASFAWLAAFAYFSRGGRTPDRFLLASWVAALSLLAGEWGARLIHPDPPPGLPWPPMVETSVAADTMRGISGRIDFSVNRLGVRGPEAKLDELDLRILCVGGSTTQCRYVTDRASWPWKLQDDLAARTGKRVFVGNAGKPGQMTAEHDRLLREYPLAPQFDWVIALCGINDANVSVAGNHDTRLYEPQTEIVTPPVPVPPWYAYYRGSKIVRIVEKTLERRRSQAMVEDPAGEWYRAARKQRKESLARRTLTAPPDDLPRMLANYRTDLRNLISTCRRLGVKLLLLTQPTRFGPNLPSEVTDKFIVEHYSGAFTPEAYAQIMAAYNRTLLEVAAEEGIPAIDLAALLPKDDTVFYDECHYNVSGCAQVAAILAEFFAKQAAAAESPESTSSAASAE